MPKKFLSLLLAGLLIQLISVQSVSASPLPDKQTKLAEKVKEGVSKLGVGQDARVELKLRDKTKLAGYISEVKKILSSFQTQRPAMRLRLLTAMLRRSRGTTLGPEPKSPSESG
jgi:ribosomal protein S18